MEGDDRLIIRRSTDVSQSGGVVLVDSQGKAKQFAGARCDVVFVIDTTGSMSDKIESLLATCQRFVDEIAKRQIDWQIAVVGFGDLTVPGDKIVATGFSRKVEVVKKSLREIPHYSGGGNDGESSLEALDRALGLQGFRQGAIKVFVHITDEPALQRQIKPHQETQKLLERGVLTFVISPDLGYFKEMAVRTGGEWFLVSSSTDFLSILDRLFAKVSQTVIDVQLKAGGDVQEYLRLQSG